MSRTRLILLAIALLVLAGGVWFWAWFTASPPARDHTAEYNALASTLVSGNRDAEAWEEYRALIEEFAVLVDGFYEKHENSDIDVYEAVDFKYLHQDRANRYHKADIALTQQLFREYIESGIPERLTDVLSTPGLRPPPGAGQGVPLHELKYDQTMYQARQVTHAECARMHSALQNGDAEAAAECAANMHALCRLFEAEPVLITHLVRVFLSIPYYEYLQSAVTQNRIPNGLAGTLMDLLIEEDARESRAADVALQGEALFGLSALDVIYEGGKAGEDWRPAIPRFFWINHKAAAGMYEQHFADWSAYMRAGPVSSTPPAIPWNEYSEAENRKHAPLSNMLPAMSGTVGLIHECRDVRAQLILHLAIAHYKQQHGAPPPTLQDLVSDNILNELPASPYANGPGVTYTVNTSIRGGYVLTPSSLRPYEQHGSTW